MAAELEAGLREGLDTLGLALTDEQVAQLLAYLQLIQKWNQVYNLTALRKPSEMLTHHLLDSLALLPALRRESQDRSLALLDVGSGAGLPGIVVAICCPQLRVDCVDAVAKKAAFIQQTAAALKLTNLRGLHGRVESLTQKYELIVSRAFAALGEFVSLSAAALAEQGAWIAMKAKLPEAEIAALPPEVEVFHVEQLAVPGLDANRCLVWMRRRPS